MDACARWRRRSGGRIRRLRLSTSKLQQDASGRLGFNVRRTMGVAQRLYEGVEIGTEGTVGLITYMRTDSTRVAPDAIEEAREFIGRSWARSICRRSRTSTRARRTRRMRTKRSGRRCVR